MSGIEPESERFNRRISTSVVGCKISLDASRPTKKSTRLAAGARKPLFRTASGITCAATPTLWRPIHPRSEVGDDGRGPALEDHLPNHSLMQRGEEQSSLCVWHVCFALIYRGRRLSARNPGLASPVEANHPRAILLYTRIVNKI